MLTLFLMSCGVFTLSSCKNKVQDSETDLEIFYWEAGYGSQWLKDTIAAFKVKYPNVNVIENFSTSNNTWESELVNPTVNTVDLYISTMTNFLAYTDYLEPLDECLDVTLPGENIKLIDKFNPLLLNSQRKDGKLYASLHGGGVAGLFYNDTIFQKYGFEIPRTTDELIDLAQEMIETKDANGNSASLIPFIHCSNADYWQYCYLVWAAQYGGLEEEYDFWQAKYTDPVTGQTEQPSLKAFKSDARKKALDCLYDVIAPEGYTFDASNSTKHTTAQTYFLSGRDYGYNICMMPNGSWLENEMRTLKNPDNIKIMKTPIISALGEKIGLKNDAQLAELVSYVDSNDYLSSKNASEFVINSDSKEYNAQIVKTCTKEQIEAVAAARNIIYTETASSRAIVPNYAKAKDYALKFIQFMNSDEALNINLNALKIKPLATICNPTTNNLEFTDFEKTVNDIISNNPNYVFRDKSYPLFYSSSITEFYPSGDYKASDRFTARNKKDKLDSDALWKNICDYYDQVWDNSLTAAGLK